MNILLVDDEKLSLALLEAALRPQGYGMLTASDGPTAISLLEKSKIDLVISDVVMNGMSGFDLAREIKGRYPYIPVMLLTTLDDKEDIIEGLASGADEFLSKPFVREELILRVRNLLSLKEYQNALEDIVARRIGEIKQVLADANQLNREMIYRLLTAAEYRDDDTGKHIVRVAKNCRIIAGRFGFKGEFLDLLENAAPMHDIGKIGIPDRLLLKPGKLTGNEFEIMKTHTRIGASILAGSSFPLLTMSAEIALTHHEKWNGAGYPDGKKGNAIPIAGRIVALADVLDALMSKRVYKPALSLQQSMVIIDQERGVQFDPDVVDAFKEAIDEIRVVYKEYSDSTEQYSVTDLDDFGIRR